MTGANDNRLAEQYNMRLELSTAIFELRIHSECVIAGIEKIIIDNEGRAEVVERMRKVIGWAQTVLERANSVEQKYRALTAEIDGVNEPA